MTEQLLWSMGLMVCWLIVAYGQFHQGALIKQKGNSENVSVRLPIAVFTAQCILFVKGIYYGDWSLIVGCLIVNSGVVFNLYQLARTKRNQ
jgi:uncharacterized membrane protein YhdT